MGSRDFPWLSGPVSTHFGEGTRAAWVSALGLCCRGVCLSSLSDARDLKGRRPDPREAPPDHNAWPKPTTVPFEVEPMASAPGAAGVRAGSRQLGSGPTCTTAGVQPPPLQAVAGRSPRRGLRRGRASLRGATGAFCREQPAALPGRAGRGGPSGGTAFRPEITGIRLRRGQSGSSVRPQGGPRSGSSTPPADGGSAQRGQLRGLRSRRGNSRFFTEPGWMSQREVLCKQRQRLESFGQGGSRHYVLLRIIHSFVN